MRVHQTIFASLAIALLLPSAAFAGLNYYFVDIANTNGFIDSFGAPPALNDQRQLAFLATNNGDNGIYRASMKTPVNDMDLVIDTSGTISFFNFGDLSNSNVIASTVQFNNGEQVITEWPGGGIADNSGSFQSFGEPQLNGSGAVFRVSYNGGGSAIVTGGPGAPNNVTIIFDESGPYSGFGDPTFVNLTVVVPVNLDGGGQAVVTKNGEVVNTIADTTGMFGGPQNPVFGPPAGNGNSDVAFLGRLDNNGSGIYRTTTTSPTNAVTTIADTSGPFFLFGNRPTISFDATVAFRAFFTTKQGNSQGIFTGADIDNDAIIKIGDPLFGSTVTGLNLGRNGFNGFNELGFTYFLDDGRQGIAVAVPGNNPCPWDVDGSGTVDTGDLLALFAQWGTDGPADFDGSGAVGTGDLLILFANWGPCP